MSLLEIKDISETVFIAGNKFGFQGVLKFFHQRCFPSDPDLGRCFTREDVNDLRLPSHFTVGDFFSLVVILDCWKQKPRCYKAFLHFRQVCFLTMLKLCPGLKFRNSLPFRHQYVSDIEPIKHWVIQS